MNVLDQKLKDDFTLRAVKQVLSICALDQRLQGHHISDLKPLL